MKKVFDVVANFIRDCVLIGVMLGIIGLIVVFKFVMIFIGLLLTL